MPSSPQARPPPPFIKPSVQNATGTVSAQSHTTTELDDFEVSNQFVHLTENFLYGFNTSSDSFSSSAESSTTSSFTSSSSSPGFYSSSASLGVDSSSNSSNSTTAFSPRGSSASSTGSLSIFLQSYFPKRCQPNRKKMGGPLDMTVPELLKHWSEYRPDHPALIFRHPTIDDFRSVLTFKDLYVLGKRCAAFLKSRGILRESVILVLLRNSPERAILEAAALLLGCFTVTATCRKKDGSDLLAMMKHTFATCVVLDTDIHFKAAQVIQEQCQLCDPIRGRVFSARFPDLRFVLKIKRMFPPDDRDFLTFLREQCTKEYTVIPPSFPHHPCVVLCAGMEGWGDKEGATEGGEGGEEGEEGKGKEVGGGGGGEEEGREVGEDLGSKGLTGLEERGGEGREEGVEEVGEGAGKEILLPRLVVHSHRNIVAFSKIFMPRTDSPRPMYFLSYPFGTVQGHLAQSLCNPVTRILLDERQGVDKDLFPMAAYKALNEEKCPIAVLPPSVIRPLAQIFQDHPGNEFRLSFLGFIGEEVNSEMLTAAFQFSHMVMLTYVSPELLLVALDIVSCPSIVRCGQPIQPGVFINIVDDDENDLPLENLGYLRIRTPLMFKKYLYDPQGTEACFAKDGFFKTGDLGQILNNNLYLNPKN